MEQDLKILEKNYLGYEIINFNLNFILRKVVFTIMLYIRKL